MLHHRVRRLLVLLLGVALVACGVNTPPQTAPPSARPAEAYPDPFAPDQAAYPGLAAYPLPSPSAIPAADLPPCKLPVVSPDPAAGQAVLAAYAFAPPEVIFTGVSLAIADWLPDSQRVLLTQVVQVPSYPRSIDRLDVTTGHVEQLLTFDGDETHPHWLEQEQALVFLQVADDLSTTVQVWREADGSLTPVAQDLGTFFLALGPDERQLVVFARQTPYQPQLVALDGTAGSALPQLLSPPLQPQRALHPQRLLDAPWALRAAWQPKGDLLAVYNDEGFYLLDTAQGNACTLDLNPAPDLYHQWAIRATWSPDGQLLAIITTQGSLGSLSRGRLTILDTTTNDLRHLDLGVEYIAELAWAPNSRQLLVLADTPSTVSQGFSSAGLYLVDALSGAVQHVLPDTVVSPGGYWFDGGAVAWSPDGRHLLVLCPEWEKRNNVPTEDRICRIAVTQQP